MRHEGRCGGRHRETREVTRGARREGKCAASAAAAATSGADF